MSSRSDIACTLSSKTTSSKHAQLYFQQPDCYKRYYGSLHLLLNYNTLRPTCPRCSWKELFESHLENENRPCVLTAFLGERYLGLVATSTRYVSTSHLVWHSGEIAITPTCTARKFNVGEPVACVSFTRKKNVLPRTIMPNRLTGFEFSSWI